jgi:transcriptional regulator with XRE-family HTH domain
MKNNSLKQNLSSGILNKKKINYKELGITTSTGNGIVINLAMRLKILRQMTNLTVEEYCKKYGLSLDQYKKYENGDEIISNGEIRDIITKMFFDNDIFCRSEWVEGYEKIAPIYITKKTISLNNIKPHQLSKYGRMFDLAYLFKSLDEENNIIGVVADSLMGKLYKKGTIVVGKKYDLTNETQLKSIVNEVCIVETSTVQMVRQVTYINNNFFCNSIDPIRQTIHELSEVKEIAKVEFIINKDLSDEESLNNL